MRNTRRINEKSYALYSHRHESQVFLVIFQLAMFPVPWKIAVGLVCLVIGVGGGGGVWVGISRW